MIFRQYYHMLLAGALLGACYFMRSALIPQNRDHRVHRAMITTHLCLLALSGTLVRGGFGWALVPRTMTAWRVIDVITWLAWLGVVLCIARGMTDSISCLRPDVAFPQRRQAVAAVGARRSHEIVFGRTA